MIVSTHPLAEEELVGGAVYYAKEANAALGEDFIGEFERSIALLRQYPRIGSPWRGGLRRLPMRRFPYSVVYTLSGEVIRVVAVAHQSRRPGYWRGRT